MSNPWEEWGSDHEFSVVFPVRKSDRCYVYLAWGSEARPLYIGKAVNVWDRIALHMLKKPWASEVVRWELHGFSSESAALNAENEAIRHFDPIHNVIRRTPMSVIRENYRRMKADEA
jgi:excinuclease UvrABC nuclease subunit